VLFNDSLAANLSTVPVDRVPIKAGGASPGEARLEIYDWQTEAALGQPEPVGSYESRRF